ncbi:hypothetical protein NMG60_11031390 [Bertholletia excelsa]
MENRLARNPNHAAGGAKAGALRCKRHPKHQQSPGVCSLCLRERLSQLSTSNPRKASGLVNKYLSFSSSSSDLSPLSSHCSSYQLSPVRLRHRRATEAKGWSGALLLGRSRKELKKSRSLACVAREREREEGREGIKKKSGFWSKLLHRSKTIKDQGVVAAQRVQ